MKPLFVFLLCVIILAALALAFPHVMLNPGPLLKGHEKLKTSCMSCHEPFGGTTSARCITCHKPGDIGIRTVAGERIPADSGKTNVHKALAGKSCTGCHSDHKGAKATALRTFRHLDLPPEIRRKCIDCHRERKPEDEIHRSLSSGCAQCHTTERWKPATFDHRNFNPSSGKQCITCHKEEKPNDALHKEYLAACGSCHSTSRWKPATFNHNRYFRLDGDHRASCRTCHTDPANYKTYTCYNCHEHSAANIAAEHREEGIYRYDNCMKCHRSGKTGQHED